MIVRKLAISACIALLSVHLTSCAVQEKVEVNTDIEVFDNPYTYEAVIVHLLHITSIADEPVAISNLSINRGACRYQLRSGSWELERYSSTATFRLSNCEITDIREASFDVNGKEYTYEF